MMIPNEKLTEQEWYIRAKERRKAYEEALERLEDIEAE